MERVLLERTEQRVLLEVLIRRELVNILIMLIGIIITTILPEAERELIFKGPI